MRNFLYLAILVLIILSYIYLDIPIARYFHTLSDGQQTFFTYLSLIGDPSINLTIWPVIYFYVRFIRKNRFVANKLLLIVLSLSLCHFIDFPLKILFGRARPELLFSENLYGFQFFEFSDKELSFPSGHAITVSAIMGSLNCLYPRHGYAFLGFALLISLIRVVLTAHYLSDVLVSLGIGFMVASIVYTFMNKEIPFFKGEAHANRRTQS